MNWNRREITGAGAALFALGGLGGGAIGRPSVESVTVDLNKDVGPLEHIWSRCGGSDRAEITMRDEWRRDAKRMRGEAGLERVRFHGIFDDELGVWGKPRFPTTDRPNFQNVDVIYDGLLDLGIQPFVELSFMPSKLASGTSNFFGMYKANITPPKSLTEWEGFIREFAQHLIGRYGATEVRQWYFEVWNEPNLPPFWSGTQAQYFELYRVTASALKGVDPALKVGGPSTSAVQWIPEFLDYCIRAGAPVDFVSTHLYAGDNQKRVFGSDGKYSQNDVIPAGVAQVRAQIDSTPFKGTELWLGEWSSDSPAMIGHVISHCLPNCHAMSHWAFSGTYEEIVVASSVITDGDSGWSLFAPRCIPKPAFNTYKLMNRLGQRRLQASGPALASRLANGGNAILVWNLANVTQAAGIPGINRVRKVVGEAKRISVVLHGAQPEQQVKISYVDHERGSPQPAWRAMGSPQYLSRAQLAQIRATAEIAAPEIRKVGAHREVILDLPAEGVALLELD